MNFKNLILEKEGVVSTLSFNRPSRLNSMTVESLEELIESLKVVSQDNKTRVLIVTGVGEGFCSGADMDFLQYLINLRNGAQFRRILRDLVQGAINSLEKLEIPVIAAVNGAAVGGGAELTLACDFRIASEKARFIFTEVKLGIIPDAGGIPRLTRLVGLGKAKEIILTGQIIEGREAEGIGLVNKCVSPNQLMAEVKQWADRLTSCSPMAMGVAKRMIDQTIDIDLMTALDMVGFAQSELLNSKDFEEGIRAFLEKRKPVFKGM